MRFLLAEPHDRGTDPLPGLKLEARSLNGVGKDAFQALHLLGSGTFTKVETGHADTFELRPDEAGQRYLRVRMKAGGTTWIVITLEDEDVAATYFGAEPGANRPRLRIDGESAT